MQLRYIAARAALTAISLSSAAASPATISVDCAAGSDSGDGTPAKPFLSLSRARDAVRALQPLSAPLSVLVAGDCVPRAADGSVDLAQRAVLELDPAQDSGSAAAPITWTAAPNVTARVIAGAIVPPSAWKPTPGKPGVFQADLGANGLDVARYGYGGLASGGLGSCTENSIELFYNSSAAVLARYPNILPNGTWQWLNIAHVQDPQHSFSVNGSAAERALTWASEPNAWVRVH